jgi:predicted XRE-type DNA-binding protein
MRRCNRKEPKASNIVWEVSSGNVFKDLGFSEEEAVNLLARAQLMSHIRSLIQKRGWSQRKAARELGVLQPRIAEVMGMRTQRFSVDLLLKYLDKLGQRVHFMFTDKGEIA